MVKRSTTSTTSASTFTVSYAWTWPELQRNFVIGVIKAFQVLLFYAAGATSLLVNIYSLIGIELPAFIVFGCLLGVSIFIAYLRNYPHLKYSLDKPITLTYTPGELTIEYFNGDFQYHFYPANVSKMYESWGFLFIVSPISYIPVSIPLDRLTVQQKHLIKSLASHP